MNDYERFEYLFRKGGQTVFEERMRKMKVRIILLEKDLELVVEENKQLRAEVEMLRKMVPQNVRDGWVNPDILAKYQ